MLLFETGTVVVDVAAEGTSWVLPGTGLEECTIVFVPGGSSVVLFSDFWITAIGLRENGGAAGIFVPEIVGCATHLSALSKPAVEVLCAAEGVLHGFVSESCNETLDESALVLED
mmetsp:Transcript_26886/g.63160  ORF Transcript_26886/g.63160 Transcript_26886/m.63160 type:complete len:115 (+) Transcript_26886:3351-3695(+)